MYLKRLEIQGFKSFANKTVLEFLPPKNGLFSITAIVGPNGAGKSNVTDAIRWVMGETSMKNLRGKKSEDVIFNGSEMKGALGVAEVTMVLDNTAGEAGIDYPEVVISRRLYRSGESEYIVNGSPVRLLDVHLLLARSKFAEHAYSIVSQGMIDRLLTVSAPERKDFFDEACGIKEHQIKQHQSQLKLARTEENIRQAETLLTEVEPRLKILSRQVKKLEKRQEVEVSLNESQEKYYYTIYKRHQGEIEIRRSSLSVLETDYRRAFVELQNVQTELAELARSSSRQDSFDLVQNRHQEAVHTKNDLERRLAIMEGQMQTEYNRSGAQNVGWLEGKANSFKETIDQLGKKLASEERDAGWKEESVTEQKKIFEGLTIEHTELKVKISRLESQILNNQSEQNYLQFSGLTAVKAVLEAHRNFGKVYGLVAELGEVAEKYHLAMEVAAGSHLSSIVVGDENVARLAIDYLREHRYGVASFLPLNRIEARGSFGDVEHLLNESGVIGKAIDLVNFDAKFSAIFSLVFGNTLVVEDLKVAERIGIGRARMVTLAGDLIEKKGIIRGGFRQRKNNLGFSTKISFNDADRLAEIQTEVGLEKINLSELEKRIEAVKSKMIELEVSAASAHAKVAMIREEQLKQSKEIASFEQELSLAKSTPAEYGEHLRRLTAEKIELAKQIDRQDKAIATIAEEIRRFNEEEEKKKRRVFDLQNEMQRRQGEVNDLLNRRNDLNIELAKLDTKLEDLSQEVSLEMKTSLQSIVARAPVSVEISALEELAGQIQKLKYQLSLIGGIDEEVIKEYSETKERYDFLTGQLTDLRSATLDLTAMIKELDDLMKKKRGSEFKKIRKEFDRYFKILFGGGKADLEEVYGISVEEKEMMEENALNAEGVLLENESPKKQEKILTGIEVIAIPPGKKVKYLNMLSGGERTLTSIALICAILYHNPSPFVVLDEVEAALDEANTLRFAKIMSELSTRSQFIIVTHNRVTMHAASALYGVVMNSDGISKLLSVKVEDIPQFEQKMPVEK